MPSRRCGRKDGWDGKLYRVSHLLVDLGWVDSDLGVPPSGPAAQPLLPNSHQPRQNRADTHNSSQPNQGLQYMGRPVQVGPEIAVHLNLRKWRKFFFQISIVKAARIREKRLRWPCFDALTRAASGPDGHGRGAARFERVSETLFASLLLTIAPPRRYISRTQRRDGLFPTSLDRGSVYLSRK